MKLNLKNVGIINKAEVNLNGLTVITGENGSGKTTVGKALFALLDSVENIDKKALNDKRNVTSKEIQKILSLQELSYLRYILNEKNSNSANDSNEEPEETILDYINKKMPFCENVEELLAYINHIQDLLRQFDHEKIVIAAGNKFSKSLYGNLFANYNKNLEQALDKLEKLKEIILSDPELHHYASDWILLTLNEEFSSQICPIMFNPDSDGSEEKPSSELKLSDGENIVTTVKVKNNTSYSIDYNRFNNNVSHIFLLDNIVDIDYAGELTSSSRVQFGITHDDKNLPLGYIDYINSRRPLSHNEKNRKLLTEERKISIIESDAIADSLKTVFAYVDEIIPGSFIKWQNNLYYTVNSSKLNVKNLASGSKAFAILKILLEKGFVNEKTILVLDEPEVHLHPQWQNKFAELLVLLVKELNVKIVLTTHSPNFLLALETFRKKYELGDAFSAYVAECSSTQGSTIEEITDDLEKAYTHLAHPYLEMDALRDSLESEDSED